MKSIEINNLEITYQESLGQSETTFLCVHGNSASSQFFNEQLEGSFGKKYKVIALDLPGHGNSSKACKTNNQYSIGFFSEVLVSFIIELNLKNIVLVGHSLGGHISLNSISPIRNRLMHVVTFGMSPLGQASDALNAFNPSEAFPLFFQADLSNKERSLLRRCLFSAETNSKFEWVEDVIAQSDPLVRKEVAESLATSPIKNEVDIVNSYKDIVSIILCNSDILINSTYQRNLIKENSWNFIFEEKFAHCPQLEQYNQFNHILEKIILEKRDPLFSNEELTTQV